MIEYSSSRFHAAARQLSPTACIRGDGPFAVISACGHPALINLYADKNAALAALETLNSRGCDDRGCARLHRIEQLG